MTRLYIDTWPDPDHNTSHEPVPERAVDDVPAMALGNVGADVSARATLAATRGAPAGMFRIFLHSDAAPVPAQYFGLPTGA